MNKTKKYIQNKNLGAKIDTLLGEMQEIKATYEELIDTAKKYSPKFDVCPIEKVTMLNHTYKSLFVFLANKTRSHLLKMQLKMSRIAFAAMVQIGYKKLSIDYAGKISELYDCYEHSVGLHEKTIRLGKENSVKITKLFEELAEQKRKKTQPSTKDNPSAEIERTKEAIKKKILSKGFSMDNIEIRVNGE